MILPVLLPLLLGAGYEVESLNIRVKHLEDSAINVRSLGARGDGVTDDTSAIQSALTAAAGGSVKTVQGNPGETYLVSYVGTVAWVGNPERYALTIASGVTLDCRGATLKLANGSNAAVLINASAGTGTDSDVAVRNCVVDGNRANQTNPADGSEMPALSMYGVLRPRIENVTVKNARHYCGRFLGVEFGRFSGLDCQGSDGDGWSFGVDDPYLVKSSHIDAVSATSCVGTDGGGYPLGNLQGNGVIFTVQDTLVGDVITKDTAGGIKIQNTSANSSFNSLTFVGGVYGTNNSGIKVQGLPASGLTPNRISVSKIKSTNAYGPGLYLHYTGTVHVGSYTGQGNGTGGGYVDLWLDSTRATLDAVYIASTRVSAAGTARATYATDRPVHIGSLFVEDIGVTSGASGISMQAGTTAYIGSLTAKDTRSVPLMTSAIKYNEPDAAIDIQQVTLLGISQTFEMNATPTTGHATQYNGNPTPTATTFVSTAGAGVDAVLIPTSARLHIGSVIVDNTSNTLRTSSNVRLGSIMSSTATGTLPVYANCATGAANCYLVDVMNEPGTMTNASSGLLRLQNGLSAARFIVDKDGMPRIGIGNTAACPACGSGNRGTLCYVGGGAGVKDDVQVCAKAADDSYAWRTIY